MVSESPGPGHPVSGDVANSPPQHSSSQKESSSDYYIPSSPPVPQHSSQLSYQPASSDQGDADECLDRLRCETVTQKMVLAFLNAVANSYYAISPETLVFSFEYDSTLLLS